MVSRLFVLTLGVLCCLCLVCAVPSFAQTTSLDLVWPNTDGRLWSYGGHYEEHVDD